MLTETICPVCGSGKVQQTQTDRFDESDRHTMRCLECKSVWTVMVRPYETRVIMRGDVPKPKNPDARETIHDFWLWAHRDAFVRGDEYPHVTCDEILEVIDEFTAQMRRTIENQEETTKERTKS
jgi:hypothetical protein